MELSSVATATELLPTNVTNSTGPGSAATFNGTNITESTSTAAFNGTYGPDLTTVVTDLLIGNITATMATENFTNSSIMNSTTHNPNCDLNDMCKPMDDYMDLMYDYIVPEPGEWGLIITYFVTFLVGLFGNILVCFAIWRNKNMRTITNMFIVNLSLADLAVIILCLPSALSVDVTETWFLGVAFCKIHIFLTTVSVSVSVLTLSAISVERWYAICRPLQFHATVRRARVIIVLIWIVSSCVATPEVISATVVPHNEKIDTVILSACFPALWKPEHVLLFQIGIMVALYFVPLCMMTFTYTHIALVLWKEDNIPGVMERRSRQPMINRTPSDTDEQIESRKKAAKMLVAVVIVFGLCFLPVHVLNLLRYTNSLQELQNSNIFALFAHWATFLNSCINPIIYNFMSDKFRKEFKVAVVMCLRCGRKQSAWQRHDMYKMTFNSGRTYSVRYSGNFNGHSVNNTYADNITIAQTKHV